MARNKSTPRFSTCGNAPRRKLVRKGLRVPPVDDLQSLPCNLDQFVSRLIADTSKQRIDAVSCYGPMYRGKFQLAAEKATDRAAPSKKPLSDETIKLIMTREEVLEYLAPHELLALWRTSKDCWLPLAQQRKTLMIQSVFRYLRVSEEAAQHVQLTFIGGWKSFLPRLVAMCEYLAKEVYGELEPDLAHRVFVAEQACFYNSPNLRTSMGQLAAYEKQVHDRYYQTDGNDDEDGQREVPPLLDLLRSGCIGWGHPESLGWINRDQELLNWFEENRQWMKRQVLQMEAGHHDEFNEYTTATATRALLDPPTKKARSMPLPIHHLARNPHIRRRITKGLHPNIWLSSNVESEATENVLLVGPNMEQIVCGVSCFHDFNTTARSTESYATLQRSVNDNGFRGIVDVLIGSPCSPYGTKYGCKYTLGMCIWCMRHRIPPFDNPSINWNQVVDAVMSPWLRPTFSWEGNRITLSNWQTAIDPVFYREALTSSNFGPANLPRYTALLLLED